MGADAVAVVATGGTIAARAQDAGGTYTVDASGDELLATLAPERPPCPLRVSTPLRRHSYMLTIEDVVGLVSAVRDATAPDEVAGAVVTMGTAAIDEVAFLVDLLWTDDTPVVLTGAMRSMSQAGYDGGRNLLDAVLVARDGRARGRGALVCLAGEAHAAREVQKLHKTSVAPLVSWPGGPVAAVEGGGVAWLRDVATVRRFGGASPVGPVPVVKVTLGDDGALVRAALAAGARGLVVEGFPGGGGVTGPVMAAVRDVLAAGIPVLSTSRAPLGRGVAIAAGGAGPADLVAAGAVACGDLPSPKARLLLMCALDTAARPDDVPGMVRDAVGAGA